jgi:hypothetical protein
MDETHVGSAPTGIDATLPLVLDSVERRGDVVDEEAQVVQTLTVGLEPIGERPRPQRLEELDRRATGIEISEPDGAIEHVIDMGWIEAEPLGPPSHRHPDIPDRDSDMIDASTDRAFRSGCAICHAARMIRSGLQQFHRRDRRHAVVDWSTTEPGA